MSCHQALFFVLRLSFRSRMETQLLQAVSESCVGGNSRSATGPILTDLRIGWHTSYVPCATRVGHVRSGWFVHGAAVYDATNTSFHWTRNMFVSTTTMKYNRTDIFTNVVILQLHRGYFTQGLSGSEPFTLSHPYAPSVVATYCSACRLLSILETAMKQEPLLCKRVFGFWFNMFSAVVSVQFGFPDGIEAYKKYRLRSVSLYPVRPIH